MLAHDREVAGLRCMQALEILGAYADDELPPDRRAQVEAHLAGCDWCERFGGAYLGVLGRLRLAVGAVVDPEPPPRDPSASSDDP